MELSQLRKLLLAQHGELRDLAASAAELAARAGTDPDALAALRALMARLATRVTAHNAFEEEELHPILPGVDAWGQLRDDEMQAHHQDEHGAIRRAILDAGAAADAALAAAAAAAVVRELLAHMDAEEREFLGPEVLKDDIITSGVGG